MHRPTYWIGLLGSSTLAAALMAPTLGFTAPSSVPTAFNPTVIQTMDYVSGRTAMALNAPTAIPQWQQGYLSANATASRDAYRVDLWDTRSPLPLNFPAIASDRSFSGGASFGEMQLAAPLSPLGSPGHWTPLIQHNPMWVQGASARSGLVDLADGVRATGFRAGAKRVLEWREGDWTIQVSGTDAAAVVRSAQPVARLLHVAFLPPYPGVYAVDVHGDRATTTIDWARGKTLAWVANTHASVQNAAATGRMAVSWRAFASSGVGASPSTTAMRLGLGEVSVMLPAGWTRDAGTKPEPGSKSVEATSSNGASITLSQLAPTRSNVFQLLPQLPKPTGLTKAAWNKLPYFSESRTQLDGVIQWQMTDLTPSGVEDVVSLQMPTADSAVVDQIQRSLRVPRPATVTQAVHLLLTLPNPGDSLPRAMAQADSRDNWVLVGGSPATAQEGWFLFRTENVGATWQLIGDTTWSAPFKTFPDSVGVPAMLFWNARDGIIVMPSFASNDLFVYRSTDGGTSWTESQLKTAGEPNNGKAPEIVRAADGRLTVSAVLYSGTTVQFVSTNGGVTWNPS